MLVGQVNEKAMVFRLVAAEILYPIDAAKIVVERSLLDVLRNHQPSGCVVV